MPLTKPSHTPFHAHSSPQHEKRNTNNAMSKFLTSLNQMPERLSHDVPLAPLTWFKVGGTADLFFEPHSFGELSLFLTQKPDDLSYYVLGAGSNLLVRDGGFRGAILSLKRIANTLIFHENNTVDVGSAVLDKRLAKKACEQGLSGFEFLYTIPGTIGGALRMNAGAFDRSMDDLVIHVMALDPKGNMHQLSRAQMGFSYRQCQIPEDWIFLGARLQGAPEKSNVIEAKMEVLSEKRRNSQPTGRTGGSTFKNPAGHKAWELIESVGLKGYQVGGAHFSTKHCNFMINAGNATSADLEALGAEAQKRVQEKHGILLEWEIRRIGNLKKDPQKN